MKIATARWASAVVMMKLLAIAVFCGISVAGYGAESTVDGEQWKRLSDDQKDGYLSGAFICRVLLKGNRVFPDAARSSWVEAVNSFNSTPGNSDKPAVLAFDKYAAIGKRLNVVADYFDGEFWRQTTFDGRVALVSGFIDEGCADKRSVDVLVLVRRVSRWYGVADNDVSVLSETHANVSIKRAIQANIGRR